MMGLAQKDWGYSSSLLSSLYVFRGRNARDCARQSLTHHPQRRRTAHEGQKARACMRKKMGRALGLQKGLLLKYVVHIGFGGRYKSM